MVVKIQECSVFLYVFYVFRFKWSRRSALLASSEATIEWEVTPDVKPGEYRIRHFGNYKYILGGIYSYQGISDSFQVI